MQHIIIKIVLIIVFCLSAVPVERAAIISPKVSMLDSGQQFIRACWLYYFDKKDIDLTIEQLVSFGINRVFLGGCNLWVSDRFQAERLKQFISLAQAQGIRVDAMVLEDPNLALREYHELAMDLLGDVLDFCAENPSSAFSGIHIDVEPHAIFRWDLEDWEYNHEIMVQYLELLDKIRAEIDSRNTGGGMGVGQIGFSAAIGWWYNEYAKAGKLPLGATSEFIGRLDEIVPMVYDDYSPPLGVGCSAQDAISRAIDEAKVMPVIIGIGTMKMPEYSTMDEEIYLIQVAHCIVPNISGVCIFDFDGLMEQ